VAEDRARYNRTVWQFKDIGAALAQLKTSLDTIVFGSAA
jgi:hypothetical protein